eukprot:EG_transcript_42430
MCEVPIIDGWLYKRQRRWPHWRLRRYVILASNGLLYGKGPDRCQNFIHVDDLICLDPLPQSPSFCLTCSKLDSGLVLEAETMQSKADWLSKIALIKRRDRTEPRPPSPRRPPSSQPTLSPAIETTPTAESSVERQQYDPPPLDPRDA